METSSSLSENQPCVEKMSFCVKPLPSWVIYGACVLGGVYWGVSTFYFIPKVIGFSPSLGGQLRNGTELLFFLSLWLVMILSSLGMALVFYMLIYKAWKTLAPLGKIQGQENLCPKLLSPGMAVGLCFIPLFSFYWFFLVFGRLEPLAKQYALLLKREYTGPARWVFLLYPWVMVLSVVGAILCMIVMMGGTLWGASRGEAFVEKMVAFSSTSSMISSIFNLLAILISCVLMLGMNQLIRNLGKVEFWVKES